MKYLPLVFAALRRRSLRTLLTMLSIVVAFFLFGALHGLTVSFDNALGEMSKTRLRVISRANMLEPLPVAHGARIAGVPGVLGVAHLTILIGYYQDPSRQLVAVALEFDQLAKVFPEVGIPAEMRAVVHGNRTGALAGWTLASRHGWKVGDRVTLHAWTALREDGSPDWTFDLVGIIPSQDGEGEGFADNLFFNYDYLDEARGGGKGTVHQFGVVVDDPARATAVALAIDALFANSSDETTTMNDNEYVAAQIRQIGDIDLFVRAILGAVMFTLLFLAGNTMMQSVRERLPEFGVLKSLGFTHLNVVALVFAEAMLLCSFAALAGVSIAAPVLPIVLQSAGLPALPMPMSVWIRGLAIATVLAAIVAALPGWRVYRLTVVDALAGR